MRAIEVLRREYVLGPLLLNAPASTLRRMAICDVCSRPGSKTVVPCAEFRHAVLVGGFSPFRLGLVPGRSAAEATTDFEFWCRMVRENETDWGLCEDCHAAYRRAAAPARGMSAAVVGEPATSLESLRRTHTPSAPPVVPADWKPNFFARLLGHGKPWGEFDDAVALLRHGLIAEARELLRRLIAKGDDGRARLLFCLESQRPPADARMRPSRIVPSLSADERHVFDMLVAFAQGNYDWLGRALLSATKSRPTSTVGAFMMLTGFVAASDLWLQTQLLQPRRREISSMIVCAPVKAIAQLLERRHEESWQMFQSGFADPARVMAGYEKSLRIEPTDAERTEVTLAARDYCAVGLGLVLFDLGYDEARRAHFAALAPRLSGNVAEACRLLA